MPVRTLIDPRLGVMALAVAAAALPFAVHAQDTKDQPPEIEALAQCRAILDPAERLGCYDRAAGAVLSATESGELRVATRDSVDQDSPSPVRLLASRSRHFRRWGRRERRTRRAGDDDHWGPRGRTRRLRLPDRGRRRLADQQRAEPPQAATDRASRWCSRRPRSAAISSASTGRSGSRAAASAEPRLPAVAEAATVGPLRVNDVLVSVAVPDAPVSSMNHSFRTTDGRRGSSGV